MSASETHNRLAREFVTMAVSQTSSREELLVVIESSLLASLHLLVKIYGVRPDHASIYLEAALQAATERFTEARS